MIVRDSNGKIHILLRNTFKNDKAYYEKLYAIRLLYTKKYQNVLVHIPKSNEHFYQNNIKNINKDLLED